MFTSYNKYNLPQGLFKAQKLYWAYSYILLRKLKADDLLMEQLLKQACGLTLKAACLLVWQKAKLSTVDNKSYTVVFLDKKTENLARLITYGNGKVLGSNILTAAFS